MEGDLRLSDVWQYHKKRWDKGQKADRESTIEVHGESLRIKYFENKDKIGHVVPEKHPVEVEYE